MRIQNRGKGFGHHPLFPALAVQSCCPLAFRRRRTPQWGGLKLGELGAKKPPDDPKPPVAQILGQIGPGKAEKRRLEQMSFEANPATLALLVPAAAARGCKVE